jgi:hypothetical protein
MATGETIMKTRNLLGVMALFTVMGTAVAQNQPQTVNGYRLRGQVTPSVWNPNVNTTTISVSPYWRPLVIQTPAYYTPGLPYVNYNQYYSFQATPWGYGWNGYTNIWGGVYDPYVSPYGTIASPLFPTYSRYVRAGYEVSPLGFQQAFQQGAAATAPTPFGNLQYEVNTGSYSAYGAFLPGTGTYLNPFTGAAYNPVTGAFVR